MAKQINISDTLFDEIEGMRNKTGVIAKQKPYTPGGCSMENQFGSDGTLAGTACIGSCSMWNRFLGRECVKVQRNLPNGGFGFSCQCMGGWWDSIWGR